MKYFVISDTHGFFTETLAALKKAGFNPATDTIIHAGDLIDRGPHPRELYRYINSCPQHIFIKGNHEDCMEKMLVRGPLDHDYHNGTVKTLWQWLDLPQMDEFRFDKIRDLMFYDTDWIDYMSQCVNAVQIDQYYITHAWMPELPATTSDWEAIRWINGMAAALSNPIDNHTVICGHWHTSWGHVRREQPGLSNNKYAKLAFDENANFDIYEAPGIIAIDACTVHSGRVNVYVFNSDNPAAIL